MRIVARKRNSGKTTMLLHYMELNDDVIMVSRTDRINKLKIEYKKLLGLTFDTRDRFFNASQQISLDRMKSMGKTIVVDDIDVIIARHTRLGYELLGVASIVTMSTGE